MILGSSASAGFVYAIGRPGIVEGWYHHAIQVECFAVIPPRVVQGIKTTGSEELLAIISASELYDADHPGKVCTDDAADVPNN